MLTNFRKTGPRTDPVEIRRALKLLKDWVRQMEDSER
jgi:hypothetical protein